MKLKLNIKKLKEIMISFNTLTGIRLVIFDSDFNEVLSYPQEQCSFCRQIRSLPDNLKKCRKSDCDGFEQCRQTKETVIYRCHAGLVEAASPIMSGSNIIGYVMFGQITDIKNKSALKQMTGEVAASFNIECDCSEIKYKSKKQILAAAGLLAICTDYILLRDIIEAENTSTVTLAKEYIAKSLCKEIRISDICTYTGVSRTRLYEIFSAECGVGIAAYIKDKRLEKAREMLKTTSLSVSQISERTGFNDYNYFSRVFRKKYSISPKQLRK